MKLSVDNKLVLLFGSGVLILLSGGYLGWFGFPTVINGKIALFKRLDNHETFEMWKNLPVPLDFKVYFFNVTNPDAVLMEKALPKLNEIGPYVYEEYISKEMLNSSNPKTLRYMKKTLFIFSEDKSNGLKEKDLVTVINLPLLAIALYLERNMPLGIDLLEEAIPFIFPAKNKLFLTDTVSNFLFDGTPLRCIEEAEMLCAALKTQPLKSLEFHKATGDFSFAFFKYKNGTNGPYEADKGLDDVRNVGQILTFKDEKDLNVWVPNSTCDVIKGTDSTIFPPFIPTDKPLYIFEPDLCISGSAEYVGEEEYLGIPAAKFVGSRSNFAEDETETNCRCPREDYSDSSSQFDCLSPGLIDLTPCQGAPVIASQPHFYQANDFLQFTSSLKAEKYKHQSYSLIDILTGTPLKAQKRLQLNIQLKPIEDVTVLTNVTDIMFPVLWVEEGIDLDTETLGPLIKLYTILGILKIARWVLLGVAVFLIALGSLYYAHKRQMIKTKKSGSEVGQQPPENVLFNKVTRAGEVNPYSNNIPPQISSNSYIRDRTNHNTNAENGYVIRLGHSLYPSTLDPRKLQKKDYTNNSVQI